MVIFGQTGSGYERERKSVVACVPREGSLLCDTPLGAILPLLIRSFKLSSALFSRGSELFQRQIKQR